MEKLLVKHNAFVYPDSFNNSGFVNRGSKQFSAKTAINKVLAEWLSQDNSEAEQHADHLTANLDISPESIQPVTCPSLKIQSQQPE